jgi:hypothetical protein
MDKIVGFEVRTNNGRFCSRHWTCLGAMAGKSLREWLRCSPHHIVPVYQSQLDLIAKEGVW